MPLIVPGINNTTGEDPKTEWMNKLAGKKLSDTATDTLSFSKRDLPKETRIIESGSIVSKDHKPDRLNVHLAKDGTVSHVEYQ